MNNFHPHINIISLKPNLKITLKESICVEKSILKEE